MTNDYVALPREPSFRVAIFQKGTTASEAPAIVLLGERTIEGSMHLETLYFKSDKYTVIIVPEDMVDGKSYCSIYDRVGREVYSGSPCSL